MFGVRQIPKNADELMQEALKQNPQFREFYDKNKDKTPEQVAKDYGLDMGLVNQMIGGFRKR